MNLLYGTAWKEDATERCVSAALAAGFRGIDTANQRKHYNEEGVGRALVTSGIPRDELFIQTKFTYARGQDHRLPYDPQAAIADQVSQSFASSLEHLRVTHVDSLVLHGPSYSEGLDANDHEAWRAMEALVGRGVGVLGASNVSAEQVRALVAFARVKPRYVQNRCYAHAGWDRAVRDVCREHGIVYQGFSLLTANRHVLADRRVIAIAKHHGKTAPQIVFRFAQQLGMLPLTGTKSGQHMREDLALDFELGPEDVATIEAIG